MPHRRRRSRLRRFVSMAGGVSATALLLFAGSRAAPALLPSLPRPIADSWPLQPFPPTYFPPPPPELLQSWERSSFPRKLFPGRQQSPPPQLQHDDAVLLPDDEVLVLAAEPAVGDATCVFHGGVSSQAQALGRLPGPGRHAYLCPVPSSVQHPPLQAPSLIPSSAAAPPLPAPAQLAPADMLLSWNDTSLVFDSALLEGGGGLLVFAKGRSRQGVNAPPSEIHCLYSGATADGSIVASFPAITSVQQLVRCPPPPTSLLSGSVTLALRGDEPLPSLATFTSSSLSVSSDKKNLICACTMVRNVAKFLPEWVRYHAAIGVDKFFLYDNGSDDDLADQVGLLQKDGFGVVTVAWPWIKTQEAGLSHCAAIARSSCQWMAFMDVDEFIFSPAWNKFEQPSRLMLEALVVNLDPQIGQLYLPCFDFGPSGQTSHPMEGVCQGYTCRLKKPNRHKSLVRLDAVADSLKNYVHHFELKSGFNFMWGTRLARINHYKFQAWEEFKNKFHRRVSAYVADWKDPTNLQSADRPPGLGVNAIEPHDWVDRYCDEKDTAMKELTTKWFGIAFRGTGQTSDISASPSPSPSPSPSL